VLHKESDVQFKMKAWANFSSLVAPLESFIENVFTLEGGKLIGYEKVRHNINEIAILVKERMKIEQRKVNIIFMFLGFGKMVRIKLSGFAPNILSKFSTQKLCPKCYQTQSGKFI
jgi:hypothetical protein